MRRISERPYIYTRYCKEVNGTETLNYAVFKSSVKVKTLKIIRNKRELQ